MQILAHRGHWLTASEKNSATAFQRAWQGGFGIETDVRDRLGTAVISHDPPDASATTLADFLQDRAGQGAGTPLALNIKSDGLTATVARLLQQANAEHYFVFDMSVPDTLHYLRAGLPAYIRLSEYEADMSLLDRSPGVWLDAFEADWWTIDLLRTLTARGKRVAIVSPELHRRRHEEVWQAIKGAEHNVRNGLQLCTDLPDQAERFFAA